MPITDELWQTIAEPFINERIKRLKTEIELNKRMEYFREVISCIKPSKPNESKKSFAPFIFRERKVDLSENKTRGCSLFACIVINKVLLQMKKFIRLYCT